MLFIHIIGQWWIYSQQRTELNFCKGGTGDSCGAGDGKEGVDGNFYAVLFKEGGWWGYYTR